MKTKYYLIAVCSLAFFSFVLTSCDKDKDGDTTKPVINLIEPEEGAVLKIGSETGVHLEMDLSDDVMLASYKIEIHNNFDGHTHSRAAGATKPFTYNKSWNDVTGLKNKRVHHHEILIPADATPGKYHLMVYCTDAAGNESSVARNIVLSLTEGEDHDHDHE